MESHLCFENLLFHYKQESKIIEPNSHELKGRWEADSNTNTLIKRCKSLAHFLGCGWEWLLEKSRTKQLEAITGIFGGERIEHPNDRQVGIDFMHSETGPQAGTCGKGVGPEKLQQEEAIALNHPLKAPLCLETTEHCKEAFLGLGDGSVGKAVATQT